MGRLKRMWDRMRGKGPKPGDVIEEIHEDRKQRLLSDQALQRMLGNAWFGGQVSDRKKILTPKEKRRRKVKRQMARESRRRNRA